MGDVERFAGDMMPGERIWVVVDLYALAMFLPCLAHLLSDSDNRTWGAVVAAILSGIAVAAGVGFRKGLWGAKAGAARND